ncbi:RplB family lipoprotein [Pseudomonas monteilii]|uniref:RplB family lipoprotein n=1 Tax=Pseudomonas monteilii TaxID=76759 RepID=A0AAE6RH88_9PSED|nr:RplB family lipoprotein [Pseudomonas monteilii]
MLNYSIQGLNNLELMSDKLEVRKIYLRDGSNITGSEQEANRAREEMRRDLVNAMVVRLQMLSPSQLDELQRKADERAQAEAAALEAARRQQAETPQQSPLEVPGN